LPKWGFYYIPKGCVGVDNHCPVHLLLHGSAEEAEHYAQKILPFASANNIILIYPQTSVAWDSYFGYTGENFLTKDGPQMIFLKRLIEIVVKPQDATFDFSTNLYEPYTTYKEGTFMLPGLDMVIEEW